MFKVFLEEAFLFVSVQLLGVIVAKNLLESISYESVPQAEFRFFPTVVFLLIILIFIFLAKRSSTFRVLVYKSIFALALVVGIQTVLSLWLSIIVSTLLAVIVVTLLFKTKFIWLHNFCIVFALAGIGGTFGVSVTPLAAVVILVIFSFYDIIAVYKTKHMVQMAQDMIQSRAIFGIVIPKRMRDWLGSLNNVEPGDRFMILGSGDMALPLILTASLVRFSIQHSFMVIIFSVAGLLLTNLLFIKQKIRRPMAALPPIAAMSIIGYLISTLIYK